MTNPLAQLAENGVSIWLDDLSRKRIDSGNLQELISSRSVSGVTTNPTIFAGAIGSGEGYADKIKQFAAAGLSATETIFELTSQDVADACDIFKAVYLESNGFDGRVSIEVEPNLANDSKATIDQALALYKKVARENVMIKIPATREGLEAITAVTAAGISVNVTLIFSLSRYAEVIDAYKNGVRLAKDAGHDISKIHSVASFFVSRVDTEVDKRLGLVGSDAAEALKSKVALANARLAYREFEQSFSDDEWKILEGAGANKQRPLMASTGVKDPNLSDTLYVTGLVAPMLVNTMPEKTMEAVFDHGEIPQDSIRFEYQSSDEALKSLADLGIDLEDVTKLLEKEGVDKFIASWKELVESVEIALQKAK
jgi:transaldolase